jgi:LysR family transcriptional regulator for metE and metH
MPEDEEVKLEIRHLKLVMAIVDEGSLTRAATRLHLTQSALSHQLRDVEEQLGAKIFLRSGRAMTLTPAGNRLLQSARRVLEELECAEKEIASVGADAEKTLTLTTQCCTVYYWLPAQLKKYQRKFPKVTVKVVVNPDDEPFEALLQGKLDLVITCNPVRNRKIQFTPLFEDENVLAVPVGHRLCERKYINAEDVESEDLFVYPPRDHSSFLAKVLKPAGVQPRSIQEVMLSEAMIEMIKAGIGIASLSRWIVAPHVASGTLATIRIGRGGFWRPWSLATRRSSQAVPHVAEFVNLLAGRPFHIAGGHQRPLHAVNFPGTHPVEHEENSPVTCA